MVEIKGYLDSVVDLCHEEHTEPPGKWIGAWPEKICGFLYLFRISNQNI